VHEHSATYRNKLASHVEALEVLEEWGAELEAGDLEARRRAYHTLIGIETMRIPGRRLEGLRRILARGSATFLARGALSHLSRRYVRGRRSYS
jgi:hypothetical protein